jgi:hypothetical protein
MFAGQLKFCVHALQLCGNLENNNKRLQEMLATIQFRTFYLLIFMLKAKYSNIYRTLYLPIVFLPFG